MASYLEATLDETSDSDEGINIFKNHNKEEIEKVAAERRDANRAIDEEIKFESKMVSVERINQEITKVKEATGMKNTTHAVRREAWQNILKIIREQVKIKHAKLHYIKNIESIKAIEGSAENRQLLDQ